MGAQDTRLKLYQSALKKTYKEIQPPYQSLELGGPGQESFEASDLEIENVSSWDLATRYHEFKSRHSLRRKGTGVLKRLRELSASAILERAQRVLGAAVRPTEPRASPLPEVPYSAEEQELDFDETLENSPVAVAALCSDSLADLPLAHSDIWMSYRVHRRQPIVLCVDTSLSMTGEKLALTAVALAVVLLEFPDDPIGIVAFENNSRVLKLPDEQISVQDLVERFLEVPAQGYTHLEDGMREALSLAKQAQSDAKGRPVSTVLLTDGKYTAGKDPAYLAPRFSHLVVLKMGRERASLPLCRELAQKGRGVLREVGELEALPWVMVGVVKDLLRGRSRS